jgi:hypothetical protein
MSALRKTEEDMSHCPIPDAALDDRLAFVGTAGSGKTHNAGVGIERLQQIGARTGLVDPLGASWGLRMLADGKRASPFKFVIFGGQHADLPLTESAGALIGETCAAMEESFILDLSELGTKASERRFMLAFLTALYRKTAGDPLHLVIDEADMFAPQMVSDKDGEAVKLLGMMETIVRRGRIKGFIPWLITQRPAVLNKNVLSQADGLIAMKLTSSQDRSALGDWIEGQADRAEGKRILASMPTLQRGQGVIWIPGRGMLETVQFPRKLTFDSSRTPTRGEAKRAVTLKPLDVDALKAKLAKVETEIAANDPKKLNAEIARLQRELVAARKHPAAAPADLERELKRAREESWDAGHGAGFDQGFEQGQAEGFSAALEATKNAIGAVQMKKLAPPAPKPRAIAPPRNVTPPTTNKRAESAPRPPINSPVSRSQRPAPDGVTAPMVRILEALAFWTSIEIPQPTRAQVGAAAGYSYSSGNFGNLLGQLRAMGLVEYPAPNLVELTDAGMDAAPQGGEDMPVRDRLAKILTGPQAKILDTLPTDGSEMSREELGAATGYSHTSGNFGNLLGQLRTLGLIEYPRNGFVCCETWVWS